MSPYVKIIQKSSMYSKIVSQKNFNKLYSYNLILTLSKLFCVYSGTNNILLDNTLNVVSKELKVF